MSRRSLAPLLAIVALAVTAAPTLAAPFPARIDLPDGWAPEGITDGPGTTAFVGSLADGAIARVNVRTGRVSLLAAGAPGRVTVGVDYEDAANRIWAAGGPTGEVRAYDARTGALLATYAFGPGFLNDVAVTDDAVYVTNSDARELEVVPLPGDGSLPDPSAAFALALTGDLVYEAGFNANGIVEDEGRLIVVQSNTGKLFRVDPATGTSSEIDLGGASVSFGDGLELHGSTLYVVRNQLNQVAVFRLSDDLASARLLRTIGSPNLAIPTTTAFVAGRLWTVNARFDTPLTPDTAYWLTRLLR
jgi:streptogramin lyase